MGGGGRSKLSEASVARLAVYLRHLVELERAGVSGTASEVLADMAGVNAANVRKDLSALGANGTRGSGYDVAYLISTISRALGVDHVCPMVVVGAGNLGRALAHYQGFPERGFRVAAVVDSDPTVVGTEIGGFRVEKLAALKEIVQREDVGIGVIAVPSGAAQEVADLLVAAGVRALLNFAPVLLNLGPEIAVRYVDLSVELQVLGFQRRLRCADALTETPPVANRGEHRDPAANGLRSAAGPRSMTGARCR
jgi:redox-sensing transcriptional repressor